MPGEWTVAEVLLRERVRITAAARLVLHDPNSADDVFQQVVLLALQTPAEWADAGHLVAWAVRAARHRALNAARDRRGVVLDADVLDQLTAELEAVPSDVLRARTEALARCLDAVPADGRRVLRLRHADGLNCGAIATRLKRSVDAVYQQLSRIHRQLRRCVERRTGDTGGEGG
jgi:RNA polymerase sigma-70 factor (ECF subfamily)